MLPLLKFPMNLKIPMILLAVRSFQIYNTKVLIFLTYYMYRFFDRTRCARRYSSHTRRLLTLRTTPRPLFNRLFIQIQCCYTVAHYCSRIRWRRWRRTARRNWRRAKLVEPALTPPRLHSCMCWLAAWVLLLSMSVSINLVANSRNKCVHVLT